MTPALWSILLTIAGIVLYHLAQHSIPSDLNPAAVVMTAYGIGAVLCLGLMRLLPWTQGEMLTRRLLHPSILFLAVACAMIELGFIWVYRAGWGVALAQPLVNTAATVLLTLIGYLVFREALSLRQWLGVVASICGLWLISGGR